MAIYIYIGKPLLYSAAVIIGMLTGSIIAHIAFFRCS